MKVVWKWMEGRTLQRDDFWIARIWTDDPTRHPQAVKLGRGHWEMEGYGKTPEEAEADLRRKWWTR